MKHDADAKTISIIDPDVGMPKAELINNLGSVVEPRMINLSEGWRGRIAVRLNRESGYGGGSFRDNMVPGFVACRVSLIRCMVKTFQRSGAVQWHCFTKEMVRSVVVHGTFLTKFGVS